MKFGKTIKVTAIICAHNEEKHLRGTIKDALKCPTANEVIVVNDGSTDNTLKIAKSFGHQIRLISYKKNRGKGHAMAKAIKASKGEVVLFLDAHLKGLKDKHLKQLAQPILKRQTNYVLGKDSERNGGAFASLTGQRAYLKEILIPHLKFLETSRFGVETYLNKVFNPRWGKSVRLKGLEHLLKHQKMPMSEVLPAYIQEMVEISKTKAIVQLENYIQVKRLVNSREVKTLKKFRERLNRVMDKEISELVEQYVLPYLKKNGKESK